MSGFSGRRILQGWMAALAAGVSALMLISASCLPIADPEAIAKQLTQLDEQWSKAAGTRNADAVASFFAADAVVYPPNAPMAVGQAAAKKIWAAGFADSSFSISWKTDHAGGSRSGELGYTAGTYQDSYKGPGGTQINDHGKYVCIWAKQADGSWKAIHDIWNTDSR